MANKRKPRNHHSPRRADAMARAEYSARNVLRKRRPNEEPDNAGLMRTLRPKIPARK